VSQALPAPALAPATADGAKPRVVSTLLGHAHVEMALLCLGSLLDYSAEPLSLRIHDDGTLTAADLARLAAGLRDPEVVMRPEADERLAELLAAHPAARACRTGNPLALKLLDVVLLSDDAELAFCDSDVLFLRPFSGLFDLPPGCGTVLMSDPMQSYSVRSWHLLLEPRLRMPAHVCTGIIAYRRSCFDLDLVEWFLSRARYQFAPCWVEQTCWALLAQAAGCQLLDPEAVSIFVPGSQPSEGQVALHFVSPIRGLLEPFVASGAWRPPGSAPPEPIAVRSFAARHLRVPDLATTEVRRRFSRLAASVRPRPR
jgi:hypothetical protein